MPSPPPNSRKAEPPLTEMLALFTLQGDCCASPAYHGFALPHPQSCVREDAPPPCAPFTVPPVITTLEVSTLLLCRPPPNRFLTVPPVMVMLVLSYVPSWSWPPPNTLVFAATTWEPPSHVISAPAPSGFSAIVMGVPLAKKKGTLPKVVYSGVDAARYDGVSASTGAAHRLIASSTHMPMERSFFIFYILSGVLLPRAQLAKRILFCVFHSFICKQINFTYDVYFVHRKEASYYVIKVYDIADGLSTQRDPRGNSARVPAFWPCAYLMMASRASVIMSFRVV